MTTANTVSPTLREPQLLGQTVVVIGGSSGIGLETARRARAEGADVVLTGRNPERLQHAALELDALSSAAFDATDFDRLERFFDDLEQKLFEAPVISVPAITIASDFDGPAADGTSYAKQFSGKYSHRIFKGIGHNVPQEAPHAFAKAVVEVDSY